MLFLGEIFGRLLPWSDDHRGCMREWIERGSGGSTPSLESSRSHFGAVIY